MTIERPAGLQPRKRAKGVVWYWVAPAAAVDRGFVPATFRFTTDWEDPEHQKAMASRCEILNADVKQFTSGRKTEVRSPFPAGTVGWMCDVFAQHEASPYRKRRADTTRTWDVGLKLLQKTVGRRTLNSIIGPDLETWHEKWARPAKDKDGVRRGERRLRRAKHGIDTFRRALSFLRTLRNQHAIELAAVIEGMRFEQPTARRTFLTYEMVQAFAPIARAEGFPSAALVLRLQLDTLLRQKDLIGEWVPDPAAEGGVTHRGRVWGRGLVWGEHIDPETLVLTKGTSKSNGRKFVEVALGAYPETAALLRAIPREKRIGPVVVCEATGRPWKRDHFQKVFRRCARAAGIPDNVWSMDTRAGGMTESYDAGADISRVMKAAGQTQVSTTDRYIRNQAAQSAEIAQLRLARRKEGK